MSYPASSLPGLLKMDLTLKNILTNPQIQSQKDNPTKEKRRSK
jgi:hypothetical protein